MKKQVMRHKLTKDYGKRYGIDLNQIYNMDLKDLQKMTKEQLRRTLVVANQEANKRLESLSKANKQARKTINKRAGTDRLSESERGAYKRFSTKPHMTKQEIIQGIIARKQFMSTTPTRQKLSKDRSRRDEQLIQMLKDLGYDYDAIEGAKPSLKKLGQILQRMEDNHKIAAKAGVSSVSAGSPETMKAAFKVAFEKPRKGINNLYEEIEQKLEGVEEEIKAEEKANRYQLTRRPGRP